MYKLIIFLIAAFQINIIFAGEWQKQFPSEGVNGTVNAFASNATYLYVGGAFTMAGGLSVKNIARWDGISWSSLGEGVNGTVNALALRGDTLFVGGNFTSVGTTTITNANYIAMWDGIKWSPLGAGTNGSVSNLASSDSVLYVGGNFTQVGGQAFSSKLAQYSFGKWNKVGDFEMVSVSRIYVESDTSVLIAGSPSSYNALYKWNGSTMELMTTTGGYVIKAIEKINNDYYIGTDNGLFKNSTSNIVLMNTQISSLSKINNQLFIGGNFTSPSNYISRYDGLNFYSLKNGIGSIPIILSVFKNELYIGCSSVNKYMQRWSILNEEWKPVGNGINYLKDAVVYNDHIYGGGYFSSAGVSSTMGAIEWDGNSWLNLGTGVNGTINVVKQHGLKIYFGGSFVTADGNLVNNITSWNGSIFESLLNGVNGTVNTIFPTDSIIYVGGKFTLAGTKTVSNVAGWNGSQWIVLGEGLNNTVNSIYGKNGRVYAGGIFTKSGTLTVNYISEYNGDKWINVGNGFNSEVSKLDFYRDKLVAVGNFTTSGSKFVNRIAIWNNLEWVEIDGGANGNISAMSTSPERIVVAGNFTKMGSLDISKFAEWTKTGWKKINEIPDDTIFNLHINKNKLLATGKFNFIGSVASKGIAIQDNQDSYSEVFISFTDSKGKKNDTINIPITSYLSNNSSFKSFQVTISVDTNSIKFISFDTTKSIVTKNNWLFSSNIIGNKINLAFAGANSINVDGLLGNLNFVIVDTSLLNNSKVFIHSGVIESGNITFNSDTGYVIVNNIILKPNYGDVDTNNVVQANDATKILQYLIDDYQFSPQQLLNANVSSDSTISALDAALILRYVVGIEDTLPVVVDSLIYLAQGNMTLVSGKYDLTKPINLQMKLSGGNNIYAFNGLIKYDTTALELSSITWSDSIQLFSKYFKKEKNGLRFVGANSLPDGKQIVFANIQFISKKLFNSTSITLAEIRLNENILLLNSSVANIDNILSVQGISTALTFLLAQNYPNPFNPSTTLRYGVPERSKVWLSIYNTLGQQVSQIVNETKDAGYYEHLFNASQLSSGIYFYRIEAISEQKPNKTFIETKKMILMK